MIRGVGSKKVYWQDKIQPGYVTFENGRIIGFESYESKSDTFDDYGDKLILPGLVDTHVHINEPGRTEWEGFSTATEAAAAGGITTLVDMPLNCVPVTTSLKAFNEKLEAVKDKLSVDVGFHGGVVPGNERELQPMINEGICSFKAFMIDSGIDEFQWSDEKTLESAMKVLTKTQTPLLLHAEVECGQSHTGSNQSYKAFLDSRPREMEDKAISLAISLAEKHDTPIHIVHLSSATALELIESAKNRGVKVSAETCPHYLTMTSESIPDGDARYKCVPPIREKENNEQLWAGLEKGIIDFVVSDHSPCTPTLKRLEEKNLKDAWGGISSLQFTLPLMWTEYKKRELSFEMMIDQLTIKPASLVGLAHSKGRLAVGFDADFCVFDPDEKVSISKEMIKHRHKETPYLGKLCDGRVVATYLRGTRIFNNEIIEKRNCGKWLLKKI